MAQAQGRSRREFLQTVAKSASAASLLGCTSLPALQTLRNPKAVVVTFGGGARDAETFAPEGQANIPRMLAELIPQATFYTQVINHGILGHYVATASLATGVYERFNNFASVHPDNPTVFEYMRRDLHRPSTDAWVVAPSNGFGGIGQSTDKRYGPDLGARVILPKQLLSAALRSGPSGMGDHLLRDNYETPLFDASPTGSFSQEELHSTSELLNMSVADFRSHALTLSSPDELSYYIARQVMRRFAPSLLWITLHDIDIAHSGAFSLYLDGIRRSDRLCAEIWRTIQQEPEYKDRTTLYVLPDFGRDSDEDAGGNGFQHHRTGDPLSRTTWMLVLGPGVRENVVIDRPVDALDLVPTLGARLGFQARFAQGKPLTEVV